LKEESRRGRELLRNLRFYLKKAAGQPQSTQRKTPTIERRGGIFKVKKVKGTVPKLEEYTLRGETGIERWTNTREGEVLLFLFLKKRTVTKSGWDGYHSGSGEGGEWEESLDKKDLETRPHHGKLNQLMAGPRLDTGGKLRTLRFETRESKKKAVRHERPAWYAFELKV